MKRLSYLAIVFAVLVATASAQIHGVPASVLSPKSTPGGMLVPNGVPASVTSLGPRGYAAGCGRGGFGCGNSPGIVPPNLAPGYGRPHHPVRGVYGYPSYGYGYVYPYAYSYPYITDDQDQSSANAYANYQDPNRVAPTVFDNGRYTPPRPPQRVEDSEPANTPPPSPPAPVAPTTLVFKDGHQQQVGNYAIIGDTLYEVSGQLSHKIKLADLDIAQTMKVNEDRGIGFSLPSGYKPQT